MITEIDHHVARLIALFYEMKVRRFSRGVDCFIIIEEPLDPSFRPSTAFERVEKAASRSTCAGNDSFSRFVQTAFLETGFMFDIPNTTLSAREAKILFEQKFGFHYQSKSDDKPTSFNPVQKMFDYGNEKQAARELAFVLFELWQLPIGNTISWSYGDFC